MATAEAFVQDAPAFRLLEAGVVEAIAQLALAGPETPELIIDRELRAHGFDAPYLESAEQRRAFADVAYRWRELFQERREAGLREPITARQAWTALRRGMSATDIARVKGIVAEDASHQLRRLGFRWNGRAIVRGPCIECAKPFPLAELNQSNLRCRACVDAGRDVG